MNKLKKQSNKIHCRSIYGADEGQPNETSAQINKINAGPLIKANLKPPIPFTLRLWPFSFQPKTRTLSAKNIFRLCLIPMPPRHQLQLPANYA